MVISEQSKTEELNECIMQSLIVEIKHYSESESSSDYYDSLYAREGFFYGREESSNSCRELWRQRRWENISTVEKIVDHLGKNIKKFDSDHTLKKIINSNLNRKVDAILLKTQEYF